ncbi:MAG: TIGR03560 family F420-dependent LLM class oxidoreductase [Actinomycetota bacterium]
MRIGITPMDFTSPDPIGGRLAETVTIAEEIGVHSTWYMDHLFQVPVVGPASDPLLEAYTALAWTAGITSRVHLGALVTAVPYRHPGMLLKAVTTLDVLSGGRAWLGLGAAWNGDEAQSLGIPFPPLTVRYEQLADALRLAHHMFAGEVIPFQGTHHSLPRPLNQPLPIRRPPILIGGGGERRTLPLVARYADATNVFEHQVADKLDVLRRHCEREGRNFDDIVVTTTGMVGQARSVDQLGDRFGRLAELGVDQAIVDAPQPFEPLAPSLADAIRHVSDLGRPAPPQLLGAPGVGIT